MTRTARSITIAAGLALSSIPLLGPAVVAAETTPQTKAQIEHQESLAAGSTSKGKAQIEYQERLATDSARPGSGAADSAGSAQTSSPVSSGGDAAAWQLALSALLGAAVTGGVVMVTRQVGNHRQAVAQ
jgi:hypothetical protein